MADRVGDLTEKSVWVIPTETIAEGFAALLAYDPEVPGRGQRPRPWRPPLSGWWPAR